MEILQSITQAVISGNKGKSGGVYKDESKCS